MGLDYVKRIKCYIYGPRKSRCGWLRWVVGVYNVQWLPTLNLVSCYKNFIQMLFRQK